MWIVEKFSNFTNITRRWSRENIHDDLFQNVINSNKFVSQAAQLGNVEFIFNESHDEYSITVKSEELFTNKWTASSKKNVEFKMEFYEKIIDSDYMWFSKNSDIVYGFDDSSKTIYKLDALDLSVTKVSDTSILRIFNSLIYNITRDTTVSSYEGRVSQQLQESDTLIGIAEYTATESRHSDTDETDSYTTVAEKYDKHLSVEHVTISFYKECTILEIDKSMGKKFRTVPFSIVVPPVPLSVIVSTLEQNSVTLVTDPSEELRRQIVADTI